ncbi:unnamed protein product [Didymodactylos carnosus]|uniref:Uncharacterized protein n=1 Tax=Didymodactylos carnosus TaxID=1234261 RepID=A0A814U6R7_9BILA|nr:unnamed protein product [Didymodactylos carnosus]CAF1219566.1 unnamed protein product [Didymodactylos carnosus]CAF3935597.1 unnamed protein product [Didymodactylos carnosus]CAF4027755.1 unnamed protein product [Didymodactylos carnosus]
MPEVINREMNVREGATVIQSREEESIDSPRLVGLTTKEPSLVNTSFDSPDAKNTQPKCLPRMSLSPKFRLVWLCTGDNYQLLDELNTIFGNSFATFSNVDICGTYIALMNNFRLVLIVSGSFGRELVPIIHDLSQLEAIHVYCLDKSGNKKWTKNYQNVIK